MTVAWVGLKVMWSSTALTPKPESGSVCGVEYTLTGTDRVPVLRSDAVGAKVTSTVHEAPAASDAGQLSVVEKSPFAEIGDRVTAAVLWLVTVTGRVWLAVPTSWLGNATPEAGERVTALVRATRRLPAGASR